MRPLARVLPALALALAVLAPVNGNARDLGTSPIVHLSPQAGPPGSFTRVSGMGFAPFELVDIYEDSYVFYTVAADDTGSFQGSRIQIRDFFGPGKLKIQGTGETSGLSAFTHFRIHTNWAQFHATAAHTADNEFENILSPADIDAVLQLWMGVTDAQVFGASPVQVDGVVYAGADDGLLYAFSEAGCGSSAKCHPLWTADLGAPIRSTPAVGDGAVFVHPNDGLLHALDPDTGATLWTGDVSGGQLVSTTPTVVGGFVYVRSFDFDLFVFNAAGCGAPTCEPLWIGLGGGGGSGAPAVVDGIAYVIQVGGPLKAYDAAGCGASTCDALWTSTPLILLGAPSVAEGTVFAGASNGDLYAFDAAGCGGPTCSPTWTGVGPVGTLAPSMAVARGTVYIGSAAAPTGLWAFPAAGCGQATCDPLWMGPTRQAVAFGPAVANGVVYVTDFSDGLFAFGANGCGQLTCDALKTFYAPQGTDPIVTDSWVFVNGFRGLRVFGLPGLAG